MNKKYAILIIIVLLSVPSLIISYRNAISGTVIDAETGKPIEGAVVLVEWTKAVGIGDYHTCSVKIVEKITDKKGKFIVFGPFQPFFDPVDVTIYKKGYVAWNNRIIFPDYRERTNLIWKSGYTIKMEKFKEEYSYDKHEDFIRMCINSSLNIKAKKVIYDAFDWERKLAFHERMKKRGQQ